MNPVRRTAVLDFIEWLNKHTRVECIADLDKKEFMDYVEQYESSKGIKAIQDEGSKLRKKWSIAYDFLSRASSQQEALERFPK